jgi:hypothetical protein
LKTIMVLQVKAWRLREAARQAIASGDPINAGTLASQAEALQGTPAGKRIRTLSSWLAKHLAV